MKLLRKLGTRGNAPNYKHGGTKTRLHNIWNKIKERCFNPNHKYYKNYGGRGITTCNEWLEFIPFRDWALNNGYQEGLTINRIKNNGNYEPSNCDWITRTENCRNRRGQKVKNIEMANEIRYLYNTGGYTQKELAKIHGVSVSHIYNIISNKKWKN